MPILNGAVRSCAKLVALGRARALRSVRFGDEVERSFSLSAINQGDPETEIASWLNRERWPHPAEQPCVYVIAAGNVAVANILVAAFDEAHANPERAYKLPQSNKATERSQSLYVGSSKGIHRRLREHMFQAGLTTYAMNMRRWCPAGDGFVTVRVQPILGNDDDVRQALEDTLWNVLQPRFGKRGTR